MENISFSKIVSTPTLNSWSQAYNAGKLFAVLSLEKTQNYSQEAETLNILGKDLLERLEQEFFVIEDKNLESIKKAISIVFMQEIKDVNISFAAGVIINNILYLFGIGNAKTFIKRGENLGYLLDCKDATAKNIASASGFLEETDLIVLATDAFSEIVKKADLEYSLSEIEPVEITESLAPKIHKAENGKISAIVIKYGKPTADSFPTQEDIEEPAQGRDAVDEETKIDETSGTINEKDIAKKPTLFFENYILSLRSRFKKPNIKIHPSKKLFLGLIIVIVVVLIFSVFFTVQAQNNAKAKALFSEIYPQALKEYDEGQGLMDLNKSLAYDSFLAAKKILSENIAKFPEKSKENMQTQDLLKKVSSGLTKTSPIDESGLDRSKLSIKVENGSGTEGAAGKMSEILKKLGYNNPSTGNADNYNYKNVTIKVKSEKADFLNLLKKDLSKDYTVKTATSDLPPSSSTDAVIIIGK
jgi:hypothetical protein